MKKLLSVVTTLFIAFVFFASVTISPASAATKKETLQYNQMDFKNYMAYTAVLVKNIENTAEKIDALGSESDVEVYLSKSKKYLKELKGLLKKLKDYPLKNKDIQALKKLNVKMVEEIVNLYELSIQVLETEDEDLAIELESKLETFESDLEKIALDQQKLTEKIMIKYQVVKNKDIAYVSFGENGSKISSKSFTYIVKKGDDLKKIAKTYKVSASDIKKWSKLKSSKLKIGQKLKIQVK